MKIKKLLSILTVCLLMAVTYSFGGCTKYFLGYTRYGLEEAYDRGYITQEQLKSIAYYYNNYYFNYRDTEPPAPDFKLIPKKKLSEKAEKELKLSHIFNKKLRDDYPDVTVDNVDTFYYYGTYNNFAVVFMADNLREYIYSYLEEKEIGGVVFFNYTTRYDTTLYAYDLKS